MTLVVISFQEVAEEERLAVVADSLGLRSIVRAIVMFRGAARTYIGKCVHLLNDFPESSTHHTVARTASLQPAGVVSVLER
jgi:hypothetical protein